MQANKIIVIAGPSGAGKTTLAQHMLKSLPELAFSISATTRMPRTNESDGEHYHFLSPAEFRAKIGQNAFLEYEEVYDNIYYGTLKSELERIWDNGQTPVLDVDVKGALNIKKEYGDQGIFIFIHPGSEKALAERLRNRNTEDPDKLEERIARSREELEYARYFDHILYNEDLSESSTELINIVSTYIGVSPQN